MQHLRDDDGSYWTGLVFADDVRWPVERTTWTAAAVVLAADAISGATAASGLFTDPARCRPPGCPSRTPTCSRGGTGPCRDATPVPPTGRPASAARRRRQAATGSWAGRPAGTPSHSESVIRSTRRPIAP